jgi:hypothetical protein
MAENRFRRRQTAATLLKMAKATTTDPTLAARFIEAAAYHQEQAGDLPPSISAKAPDVQTEG